MKVRKYEKEKTVADGNGGRGREDGAPTMVETMMAVMVVVVEDEGRFREPRSTFNHLRSITSAEVMAAFSCRNRTGARSVSSLLSLSISFSFARSRRVSPRLRLVLLSTLCPAIAFGKRIVGEALSKFVRDCTPFEAHLIDQVLMKMIPRATSTVTVLRSFYSTAT